MTLEMCEILKGTQDQEMGKRVGQAEGENINVQLLEGTGLLFHLLKSAC